MSCQRMLLLFHLSPGMGGREGGRVMLLWHAIVVVANYVVVVASYVVVVACHCCCCR